LVQAVPDAFNQGVPSEQLGHYYHNSTFVDDNGIADIRDRIIGTIDNSAWAAYAIFGHPNDDHQAPCLSEEKQLELASFLMQYLGFLIHTLRMIMAWPVDKCQQLADLLDGILSIASHKIAYLGWFAMGQWLLHLLCTCHYVSSQHQLNDVTHNAWGSMSHSAKWVWNECNCHWIQCWYWQYHIQFDVPTICDLRLLQSKLSFAPEHPIWCWPIALLVKREPTSWCYSNACGCVGLGGWTDSDVLHHFMWHLDGNDLLDCGFALEWLKEDAMVVDTADPDRLHINILELSAIALIINIWLTLVFITQHGNIPGGHIITMLADNTSALSWIQYTSRTKHPVVWELSHFIMDLTLSCPICNKLLGLHLQGIQNIGVETSCPALSHPRREAAVLGPPL
jgi:hypothetical protein